MSNAAAMALSLNNDFIQKCLPSCQIIQGELKKESLSFSVDTRTLLEGDVFIALQGQHTDGHDFIREAVEKKASGLIINKNKKSMLAAINKELLKDIFILLVDDVYGSCIKLATEWRKNFAIPIIGITGSVGKTSTKEILKNIFTVSHKVFFASKGNQNTLIGLSMNVLQLNHHHEVAVFELGISKRSEMAHLVDVLKPSIGLVTYIGHSHMSGLGSINDIALEKRQIFKNFKSENIGIVNGDLTVLANVAYPHPVMKFGYKTTNQIQARKVKLQEDSIEMILKIYNKKYKIQLPTNNLSIVNNVLAATAVACLLGIADENILKAIQLPFSVQGRFTTNLLNNGMGKIIDDCYNANPESMKSALLAFDQIKCTGNKIAIIGDMYELGIESAFWHRQIGRFLRKAASIHHVILVGTQVKYTSKTIPVGMKFDLVATWQEALAILKSIMVKDSIVLVKGSTGGYKNGIVNIVKELSGKNEPEISLIAATAIKNVTIKRTKSI